MNPKTVVRPEQSSKVHYFRGKRALKILGQGDLAKE